MSERTIGTILEWFSTSVQNKEVISPVQWVEAGMYLATMIGDEYTNLADLENQVAQMELACGDVPSVKAKAIVKASPEWLAMRKQALKIRQIEEFIRLAKKRAQMVSDEMRL